jgi:hypothetical protein
MPSSLREDVERATPRSTAADGVRGEATHSDARDGPDAAMVSGWTACELHRDASPQGEAKGHPPATPLPNLGCVHTIATSRWVMRTIIYGWRASCRASLRSRRLRALSRGLERPTVGGLVVDDDRGARVELVSDLPDFGRE